MKILQDHIVPVVRLTEQGRCARVDEVYGTAFFLNERGAFATARHVLDNAYHDARCEGGTVAMPIRKPGDDDHRYVGEILSYSFAPNPYDVAVGVIRQPTAPGFMLGEGLKTWVWFNVCTAGYPTTATTADMGQFRIDARALKGYVTRTVPAGHFLMHPHPDVIEVNFAIPKGLSGAPLVQLWDEPPVAERAPPLILLGLCVGNELSEVVDYAHEEYAEGDTTRREKVSKVEQYGIAHDLRPLADWKPECWNGATLRETIQY